MSALVDYKPGSDSSDDDNDSSENFPNVSSIGGDCVIPTFPTTLVKSAPDIASKEEIELTPHLDPTIKELNFNPKFTELYAPTTGPENPFRTEQERSQRNMLSGFVEPGNFSSFQFENQRKTFTSFGYAVDPTAQGANEGNVIGDSGAASENKGVTVFEKTKTRKLDKRQRLKNTDASDVEGYLGPWGKFVDEKTTICPTEEEQKDLDVILAKRARKNKVAEDKPLEDEKTVLHLEDPLDYQGRSFMHVPQDIDGVNLRSEFPPDRCFIPKKLLHTWTGHTKGVQTIQLFPKFAHLLLSGGLDSKIKLWYVYNSRQCIRTYLGHKQGVRDLCFANDGKQFLSASYDRFVKLWDTETGNVVQRFTNKKIPYCVKFNPDEEKQHLFLAGTADKKIVQWDIRANEIVQEYDRHLGAVNTITFYDQNRRFVSTSDDKSLRLWEWDIPVDFKYIADPSMHSMPAVRLSPNGRWLACQSMDNQIVLFDILNRFKQKRRKSYKGHMVSGYACGLDFSPDMMYLASGDADGKAYIWHFRSVKLYEKFKAHDDVCINCLWHPHETSKLITCGWDGLIKLWD